MVFLKIYFSRFLLSKSMLIIFSIGSIFYIIRDVPCKSILIIFTWKSSLVNFRGKLILTNFSVKFMLLDFLYQIDFSCFLGKFWFLIECEKSVLIDFWVNSIFVTSVRRFSIFLPSPATVLCFLSYPLPPLRRNI